MKHKDSIAIFEKNGRYTPKFFIDGEWSGVYKKNEDVERTWKSEQEVRSWLRYVAGTYQADGGSLGWNLKKVPVVRLPRKERE